MEKCRILYAPGMGQDLNILENFRDYLKLLGNTFTYIDFPYDVGELDGKEFGCVVNNTARWWIGLSLGASLLYYLYNSAPKKPNRLTIINPFADRERLSHEKEFSLRNQWNFSPKSVCIEVEQIDLVVSVFDKSILPYHGLELLDKATAKTKNLILVKDNHQISNSAAQYELANCLNIAKSCNEVQTHGNKYCNFYHWI